jgi:hypothetical protein
MENILWSFSVFYRKLVYFVIIIYTFSRFGMFHVEKSGSPEQNSYMQCVTKSEIHMWPRQDPNLRPSNLGQGPRPLYRAVEKWAGPML